VSSDTASVTLTGAWAAYAKALDPVKFAARLKVAVERANKRIGRQFQADAVKRIRARSYADNSPITVLLKGSSAPLVDGGDLVQSITYDQPTWNIVRVGVLRMKSGDKLVNIAKILHYGAVIDVGAHPAVRRAVFAKLRAKLGKKKSARLAQWMGASGGRKDLWIIPGRPFLSEPLQAADFRAFARAQWVAAVRYAVGAKGGS
jgi:hypothetical protein